MCNSAGFRIRQVQKCAALHWTWACSKGTLTAPGVDCKAVLILKKQIEDGFGTARTPQQNVTANLLTRAHLDMQNGTRSLGPSMISRIHAKKVSNPFSAIRLLLQSLWKKPAFCGTSANCSAQHCTEAPVSQLPFIQVSGTLAVPGSPGQFDSTAAVGVSFPT